MLGLISTRGLYLKLDNQALTSSTELLRNVVVVDVDAARHEPFSRTLI